MIEWIAFVALDTGAAINHIVAALFWVVYCLPGRVVPDVCDEENWLCVISALLSP